MKSGRMFGWWYVCIGLGFAALAVRNLVAWAPRWSIILRLSIAVGFLLLGVSTLRSADANSRRQ
jgi:hypothetical protein